MRVQGCDGMGWDGMGWEDGRVLVFLLLMSRYIYLHIYSFMHS